MNRRNFLTGATVGCLAGAACSRQPSSLRTLSQNEAKTLAVLCDQVIPPDQDPGAAWAGAVQFIDIQLTRIYRKHLPVYRAGLAKAETVAREKFGGRELAALTADEPLRVMEQLEKEDREFFGCWWRTRCSRTTDRRGMEAIATMRVGACSECPRHRRAAGSNSI
jgi:hypothetical protein